MTDICKKCAECCKNFPFVNISVKEINVLEKVTGIHPRMFTHEKGTVVEEYFLQFQENGYCFFLKEHKGSFSCGVYEARPGICKNYPSRPTQKDVCHAIRAKFLRNISG